MIKKYLSIILNLIYLTVIIFIITMPKEIEEAVIFSISIWKDTLFPLQFPFYIFSSLLLENNFSNYLNILLGYPIRKIYNLSDSSSIALIISLFSGFPTGAKIVSELVKNNEITREEGEILLTFTHFSSPVFILNIIGSLLNKKMAIIILISHYLSGLITGLFFKKKSIKNNNRIKVQKNNNNFNNSLRNSIFDSLKTLFYLLGVITIFSIFTTIISTLFNISPLINSILSGILEITQGIKLISCLDISMYFKVLIITIFISFGGLSVHMQVLGIIEEQKIRYKYFFQARIIHSILSSIFVSIIYYLIHFI